MLCVSLFVCVGDRGPRNTRPVSAKVSREKATNIDTDDSDGATKCKQKCFIMNKSLFCPLREGVSGSTWSID